MPGIPAFNYQLANGNNERQMFTGGDGELRVRKDVFHFPSVGKDSRRAHGEGNAGYFRRIPFSVNYRLRDAELCALDSREIALTFPFSASGRSAQQRLESNFSLSRSPFPRKLIFSVSLRGCR